MRYRDAITIYKPKTSRYNQTPSVDDKTGHSMLGIVEQNAGLTNNGYYDQISGDAHLYLPGDDPYLKNLHYSIEGYFVDYAGATYRIESVSIGKASLTNNVVSHIECSLSRTTKEQA